MVAKYLHYELQEFEKSVTKILADTNVLTPSIVLIGPPGAGKTSVGNEIAQRHGIKHIDTDTIIELCSGLSISDIFSTYGELNFRAREKYILDLLTGMATTATELALSRNLYSVMVKSTISTGGGMPVFPGNFEKLSKLGVVVALTASANTLLDRLCNTENRPLLQTAISNLDERQKALELLLKERKSIYECASLVIDTTSLSIEEVATLVIKQVIP